MSRDIQAPMPVSMRDQTNIALEAVRSVDARSLIRRLVADAYANGFTDGGINERVNASADREAEAVYRIRDEEKNDE